ncbi:putative reverse transcriptase domain-containing protein [Tanacetum coccineum]|uniref:Reverse transcriptase domain-containing protein n=1 Tax=Tanacetum coccineum TaxID=301880 RepID=A0ABQ4YWK7_9ASTR
MWGYELTLARSNRIYDVDTLKDPRAPTFYKAVEPSDISGKTGIAYPYTAHCLASSEIMVSCLRDKDGKVEGNGFLLLDSEFNVKGRAYQSEKKHMGGYTLQQLRGYSFDEIKNLFKTTMRRVHTFIPIESEIKRVIPELAAGSSKRDAEEKLDQESSKRQKIGESSEPAEEPKDKEEELSQEELQQMMIIIIRVENHTEIHKLFDDMLKAFDRDDLVMLWSLVKEKFNSTEPTDDKEREIWVELKVHHVSIKKGIDIYMLVEKEYPLSRGTLTLMLVAKLLVDQDNEMLENFLGRYSYRLKDQEGEVFRRILSENKF